MKEVFYRLLFDMINKHSRVALFVLISLLILTINMIIEWLGFTSTTTNIICIFTQLCTGAGLLISYLE